MRGEVDRLLMVDAATDAVWSAVTDVRTVASWLPIVSDVREEEPLALYTAVLTDRVGPFKLRADLSVRVTMDEGTQVSIVAVGEDRQVKSRIEVTATLQLEPDADRTRMHIVGSYEVTGRVATLGASTIRSKAEKLTEEFCTRALAGLSA